MKNRILHFITFLLKILSGLLVGAPMWGFDSASTGIGLIIFIGISASKDLLISLGDWLDDGKRNGSFTGLRLLALCALCTFLLTALTSCETGPDGKKHFNIPVSLNVAYETSMGTVAGGYTTGKGIIAGATIHSPRVNAQK